MESSGSDTKTSEQHEKYDGLESSYASGTAWTSEENMDSIRNSNNADFVSEAVMGDFQYDPITLDLLDDLDYNDLGSTDYPDQYLQEFLNDLAGRDDFRKLLQYDSSMHDPIESNDAIDRINTLDDPSAMIETNSSTLPVVRPPTEQASNSNVTEPSIALSNSVLVTMPPPNQLQLARPLEETYRPRYKSDYFPQKGPVRRPRYVADNVGNHFITVQIPPDYQSDLSKKYIRVALITKNLPGRGYFYSPYKFQVDNENVNVPDQNPIYIPVQTTRGSGYRMKLHLVLIKSKLDQLRSVQPLQPFVYPSTSVQNLIHAEKMTPKELINRYQLDKSHLAFTLCTKLPSGSYDVHPDSTVLSSVISEATVQSSTKTSAQSEDVKKICCPKCSHTFSLTDVTSTTDAVNKRKVSSADLEEVIPASKSNEKPANQKRKKTT